MTADLKAGSNAELKGLASIEGLSAEWKGDSMTTAETGEEDTLLMTMPEEGSDYSMTTGTSAHSIDNINRH